MNTVKELLNDAVMQKTLFLSNKASEQYREWMQVIATLKVAEAITKLKEEIAMKK